jgi:hypothetical protein
MDNPYYKHLFAAAVPMAGTHTVRGRCIANVG